MRFPLQPETAAELLQGALRSASPCVAAGCWPGCWWATGWGWPARAAASRSAARSPCSRPRWTSGCSPWSWSGRATTATSAAVGEGRWGLMERRQEPVRWRDKETSAVVLITCYHTHHIVCPKFISTEIMIIFTHWLPWLARGHWPMFQIKSIPRNGKNAAEELLMWNICPGIEFHDSCFTPIKEHRSKISWIWLVHLKK